MFSSFFTIVSVVSEFLARSSFVRGRGCPRFFIGAIRSPGEGQPVGNGGRVTHQPVHHQSYHVVYTFWKGNEERVTRLQ